MKLITLCSLVFTILFSLSLYTFICNKYVENNNSTIQLIETGFQILDDITNQMQLQSSETADFPDCFSYIIIKQDHVSNFSITDISSNINQFSLPDSILVSQQIQQYLSQIEKDKSIYSWININYCNSNTVSKLKKNHNTNNISELYPLINNLPLYNIYFLDKQELLLLLDAILITDLQKQNNFINDIDNIAFATNDELNKKLSINNHSLGAALFGCKTTFWEINFTLNNKFIFTGIVSLVPSKNNNVNNKYYLLEHTYEIL